MVTLKTETTIQLLNVPLSDGRQAAAVFTSPQRIEEVFGEVGYFGIQGSALFEIICARPAILNPSQPYSVLWEPENMANMLGIPIQRVVQKETQIMLGTPADTPEELINRLTQSFAAMPQIKAAWLALAVWPQTNEQAWYLDVRAHADNHELIRKALAATIEGVDLKGYPLDMVMNADEADGSGIIIIKPQHSASTKKGFFRRLFG